MKIFTIILIISFIAIKTSFAVTIKSGEILGADGKVYKGASPEQKEKIISSLSKKDKPVEIINDNLMILYEDNLISIPLSELNGKSDKQIDKIIDTEFDEIDKKVSKKTQTNTNQTLSLDVKAASKNQTKAISKTATKSVTKNLAKSSAKSAAKSSAKSAAKAEAKSAAKAEAKNASKSSGKGGKGGGKK